MRVFFAVVVHRLCLLLEGTSSVAAHWPRWNRDFIEPFLEKLKTNSFSDEYELAVILFRTPDGFSDGVLESSHWTTDIEQFKSWLKYVHFCGGGGGSCALSEALSEAIYISKLPVKSNSSGSEWGYESGGSPPAGIKSAMNELYSQGSVQIHEDLLVRDSSSLPREVEVFHHYWLLAVSDIHRLPMGWPLHEGSLELGRANTQTLLGLIREKGHSFSVLSLNKGSASSSSVLYKKLFGRLQQVRAGGHEESQDSNNDKEPVNLSMIKGYTLLVDPKWSDGAKFFQNQKKKAPETGDTSAAASATNSQGMSSKQGEVASAALGVPFSSNQHRIGRATKQASRGQITQAKYETDSDAVRSQWLEGGDKYSKLEKVVPGVDTHIHQNPGRSHISPQAQNHPHGHTATNNHMAKPSPHHPSVLAHHSEHYPKAQSRIPPTNGTTNTGSRHMVPVAVGTAQADTQLQVPAMPSMTSNAHNAPNVQPWGTGLQQHSTHQSPQVLPNHQRAPYRGHNQNHGQGYGPVMGAGHNTNMINPQLPGVMGNEQPLGQIQPTGMQPTQIMDQQAMGIQGIQQPTQSPLVQQQQLNQSYNAAKRMRISQRSQATHTPINGHSPVPQHVPGSVSSGLHHYMTAWEGPVSLTPLLAGKQGGPNVKLFDVRVLVVQSLNLQQGWPPELTISRFKEMKDSQAMIFLIMRKSGTSTEFGHKLISNLAEKNLVGFIDIGTQNHFLGMKVKIRNGQFVLLGTYLPKNQPDRETG